MTTQFRIAQEKKRAHRKTKSQRKDLLQVCTQVKEFGILRLLQDVGIHNQSACTEKGLQQPCQRKDNLKGPRTFFMKRNPKVGMYHKT